MYVLVLAGGLLCVGDTANAASAETQLQKGIEAFRKNDNDKAMDYFVDVLMHGDAAQQARANNYIDAIHNQIGGIKTPTEVAISFPEQPTQTIVDPASNLANYGTERLNTLATEAEAAAQEAIDALGQTPQTLTEQIEARQLEGYIQTPEPVTAPAVQEELPNALPPQPSVLVPEQPVVTPVVEPVQATQNANDLSVYGGIAPVERRMSDQEVQPLQAAAQPALVEQPIQVAAAPVVEQPTQAQTPMLSTTYVAAPVVETPVQTASSTFTDLTSESAIRARNLYTSQKLQSMTDEVVAKLKDTKGVHLYMNPDGRPDAIDVDDGVLFQGTSFRSQALPTLNSIYELLALTQGAHYTILPAGSYTDDVTLPGIRQAMALKSYLVKRGISEGKLSYNMGLVDEEVPAKFSNLKGLSVVFDYDAKLPTRLLENEAKETNPLLSMAIVPPCRAIDRSLGEAYAVDFSVLETVNPLDNWTLQVIWHGRDGKYYVVRQLEGFAPVYHQILWNGRKGIIGPELPCGKYTLVLTGVDLKGNKQSIRHRVVVKCDGKTQLTGSCQTGTCPGTEKAATATTSTVLNYKSARLWKKPGRTMYTVATAPKVEEAVAVVEEAVAVVEEGQGQAKGQATSTEENTYTHTKTVRNIVTTDNTPAETVTTTSYVSEEYAPLPTGNAYTSTTTATSTTNPYEMPYEEEYTTY